MKLRISPHRRPSPGERAKRPRATPQIRHSRLWPTVQKKSIKKVALKHQKRSSSIISSITSLTSTPTSTNTFTYSKTAFVFLYFPLIITESDRRRMITALLLVHFTALVAVLVASGFATYQLNDLVNSRWSILDEEPLLDVEIVLLAGLNAALALGHVAAMAVTYLLTFNRFRISFISSGYFTTVFGTCSALVALASLSALALLATKNLAADRYESYFLEHIKTYKDKGAPVHLSAKLDLTQIIFECCGARHYTDWFEEEVWSSFMYGRCPKDGKKSSAFKKVKSALKRKEREKANKPKILKKTPKFHERNGEDNGDNGDNGEDNFEDELQNGNTTSSSVSFDLVYHQWPYIPFSCCNTSSKVPCLHFVPPEIMRHSNVDFLDANNYLVGCRDQFVKRHLWTVHRHGLGWALSVGVQLFTAVLLRYFYHSVTFSLLWGRKPDGSGMGWLRGVSPRAIWSLGALVGGYQRLEWRWPVMVKKVGKIKSYNNEDQDEDEDENDLKKVKNRKLKKLKSRLMRRTTSSAAE